MFEQEWLEIFADNLVDIMKEYRITQKELSEDSGLSEGTISNYIHKKQMPGIKAIINLAYALDISIDDFIDFGDKIV